MFRSHNTCNLWSLTGEERPQTCFKLHVLLFFQKKTTSSNINTAVLSFARQCLKGHANNSDMAGNSTLLYMFTQLKKEVLPNWNNGHVTFVLRRYYYGFIWSTACLSINVYWKLTVVHTPVASIHIWLMTSVASIHIWLIQVCLQNYSRSWQSTQFIPHSIKHSILNKKWEYFFLIILSTRSSNYAFPEIVDLHFYRCGGFCFCREKNVCTLSYNSLL